MTFIEQINDYYDSIQIYKSGLMEQLAYMFVHHRHPINEKFITEIIQLEIFQQKLLAAKSIIKKNSTKAEIKTIEEFLRIKTTKISNH